MTRLPTLQSSLKTRNKSAAALYMYLMKMRTGLPSEDIGNTFHISRVTVERYLKKVRAAMKEDFVFQHVNNIRNRDELISLNTTIGRALFCNDNDDRVVLICDGTYIYVNRSRNYEFQKQTYTDQKKRNFLKIMICVTCNGTIIHALGPYKASENDATILQSIFTETNAFDNLENNDIMILDRGFRDCVKFLQDQGLIVQMPALIQRSEVRGQLSTADANQSRFVTATRYVVEARNGHLKTVWKIFDKVWNSLALKHLADDVQICAALLNVYFKSIKSNQGIEDAIISRMLNNKNKNNELSPIVSTPAFERNLKKFEVFDDFDSLPMLTELQLIYISLGRYQIEQAQSYCQEHLKQNNSRFLTFVFPENLCRQFLPLFFENNRNIKLFLTQFKSRFVSKKKHNTFVLIDLNGTDENSVISYYCDCYNGRRTVGCCSHSMCFIWFTLFIKNRNIPKPAAFLDHYFERHFEEPDEDLEEM